MKIPNNLLKYNISKFTTYGFQLGIAIPVYGIFVAEFFDITLIPIECKTLFNIGFSIILIMYFLLILAWKYYEKHKILTFILICTITILNIISMHLLVASTGGTIQSIFKSYYLYIPVLLLITFGARYSFIFFIGTILVILSCITNIFFIPIVPTYEIQLISSSIAYKVTFIAIFLLQLYVVIRTNFENKKWYNK